MNRMTRSGIIYLSLTLTAALGVLGTTLGLYIAWDERIPETFSAAVVNTAATLAAATFVGVFDMFFTLAQMRQNEENQRQWREELQKEREKTDAMRAEADAKRAAADARLERLLEDARVEREQARVQQEQNRQLIADLLARNLELNTRLLDLLERRNGNGSAQSS